LVGIERLGDVPENSKRVQEPADDLEADDTFTALQPGDSLARNSRSVAELSLGESAKLAPCLNIRADVSQRPSHWKRGNDWRRFIVRHRKHYKG